MLFRSDRKRLIAAMENDLRLAETETAEITKDQDRIRQNLASLNRVAGQEDQVNRYARQLATQESQLATLRDRTRIVSATLTVSRWPDRLERRPAPPSPPYERPHCNA